MDALYRGTNGCYYTAGQICHYYETGAWTYDEHASEPGREVVETRTGNTVTIVSTDTEGFPFPLPGREFKN